MQTILINYEPREPYMIIYHCKFGLLKISFGICYTFKSYVVGKSSLLSIEEKTERHKVCAYAESCRTMCYFHTLNFHSGGFRRIHH